MRCLVSQSVSLSLLSCRERWLILTSSPADRFQRWWLSSAVQCTFQTIFIFRSTDSSAAEPQDLFSFVTVHLNAPVNLRHTFPFAGSFLFGPFQCYLNWQLRFSKIQDSLLTVNVTKISNPLPRRRQKRLIQTTQKLSQTILIFFSSLYTIR